MESLRGQAPAPPQQVRGVRYRVYNPATASGTLFVTDVPKHFPLFLAAVLYLKQAMREGKAALVVEYGKYGTGRQEWPLPRLYQEAKRRHLLRRTLWVSELDPVHPRFECWPGASFDHPVSSPGGEAGAPPWPMPI